MSFSHLEVHSHFTLLGATPSVAALVGRATADGLTHLALTDTNALYGAVAFGRACRAAGIQPIIGMTVTTADPAFPAPAGDAAGKLVLLAADANGYRSLCRLSSLIQGSPQREALAARGLDGDALAAHRTGLICLSGGQEGWIERFLRAGDAAAAQRYAEQLAGIYGRNFYLALELHTPGDEAVADAVMALGRRLGLAAAAVQPIFCLTPADAPRLRLLAAIRANARLGEDAGDDEMSDPADLDDDAPDDETRYVTRPHTRHAEATPPPRAPAGPFSQNTPLHWLSPTQVAGRFARFPQAVAQSGEIAARCGDCLPDGRPIWPSLALPPGQTPDAALAARAQAGLDRSYPVGTPRRGQAQDRLAAELRAISGHGFAPLFLVVADIVRFAREHEIPVSTRGSVANSLVAFCTGITTVDPIEHGLLFERFLNPARTNPPDIDLDFCSRRRDEVLRYVRDAYGADRVALIGTVSTMQPQSAVRETGKAYGLPVSQVNRLVGMLPRRWHPDPRRRDQRTQDDVLAALTDPLERETVRMAYTLVGQPDHLSVHPGGVVITPGPLTDVAPVQWAPKGFLITQFEHRDVETLGLQKMDLLGIRALTVLADAAAWVHEGHDPAFRLADIPLDDAATADLLARGETIGVFQCESDGAQRTLRKLKARGVRDLAIANAFFKPGPAMGGMAGAFVRRYRGEQTVTYLHPALEPILGPTQGVLIFQEQILRLAREIAGLTWAQADQLRRGMSHFGAQEMEALAEQFIAGCQRPPPAGPGFALAQAKTLWEQVMPFAGYGFNQGHATAYADVSFRSAYLKTHYPAQFLCARLADYGGFHHPAIYMAEAVRLGLTVRPPHINFSAESFSLAEGRSGPVLFMGLGQVRDLRQAASTAIRQERAVAAFSGLRDLLRRVELRPKEIEHLIRSGALDGLAASRAALLAEAQELHHRAASQMAFDFGRPAVPAESLRQRWDWETELLGLPVSALADPLALVRQRLPAHTPLSELSAFPGRPLLTAGVRLPGWTGGPGFFLGDGVTFVIARGDKAAKHPAPWQPLLVHGRWSGDGWGTAWLQVEELGMRNAE
ncbi:DNA polymerase III subunit alpha [Candidatus Amarolinea aalborgensis]|uniref:DNA polymerase III subunit alpha n=1 Tax=Candidatus Amarolinea aalborgensis TaxID=2249329 RepID=UPI003BFA1ED7